MKIKISSEITYRLILLFPIIDIIYYTALKGEHYSTFSIAYFSIVLVLLFLFHTYLISTKTVFILMSAILFTAICYSNSGSVIIQFFVFLIFLNVYSNKCIISELKSSILKFEQFVFKTYILYCLVLLYSVFFEGGIKMGWGTTVLYGPFSIPHILAYELLAMEALGLLIYKMTFEKKWIAVTLIFEILILLTCVRSVFLASVIMLVWFVMSLKLKKKFMLMIIGIIAIGTLFYFNAFDQIIEKTLFAYNNGSVTNGRGWIVESGKKTFLESNILEKIFGSGYFNLLRENYRNLGTAIQGHNDIITVLISFGVVGLIAFFYFLIRFLMGRGFWGCAITLFVLLYYNGLFLYMPMVIELIVIRLLFLECSAKKDAIKEKIGDDRLCDR